MAELDPAAQAAAESENKTDDAAAAVATETAAAAPAAAIETAPEAAPAVVETATEPAIGSEAWINAENRTAEEIRDYLSGKLTTEPAEAPPVEAVAEPAKAEAPVEVPPAEPAPAIEFTFTPDADDETFKTEEAKYLEMVELDTGIKTILDRKNAQIEAALAASAPAVDETTARHIGAFDRLVTFVEDPESQTFVPDTTGVIELLSKEYANELPQLIIDLNSMASKKYQGATLYQEFIADQFNLDNDAMNRLQRFFDNKGQFDVPAFVPEGVHPTLAEAFWTATDREELTARIDKAQFTLQQDPEATASEKDVAQRDLNGLNARLKQIQDGLDARKSGIEAKTKTQTQAQTAVHNEAVDRYTQTTLSLVDVIAKDAIKGLDVMDEEAAGLVGAGIGTLIVNSFSDNDQWAAHNRSELAKRGIKPDWNAAMDLREKLFESEKKIVGLEKTGAHARAIENAKKEKDVVVKQMMGLAREAGGKINAKVLTGAGKKLESQIAGAPKIVAARPKASGESVKNSTAPDYDKMSIEELRKYNRENNPYAKAARGDMSGFAG